MNFFSTILVLTALITQGAYALEITQKEIACSRKTDVHATLTLWIEINSKGERAASLVLDSRETRTLLGHWVLVGRKNWNDIVNYSAYSGATPIESPVPKLEPFNLKVIRQKTNNGELLGWFTYGTYEYGRMICYQQRQ